MGRRRTISRKPAKAQQRKPARPKQRDARPAARGPKVGRSSELTEAREQQAATAEVLRIIASSPGDLQRVFDAILANAVRLCEAKFGTLYLREGDAFRAAALHNAPPAFVEFWQRGPHRPGASTVLSRVLRTKQVVHISDITVDQAYIERDPLFIAAAELGGFRTVLAVPVLKEADVLGAIYIYRQEVRPCSDKQIALLVNFANQAIIAIENTRLLNELRESLERQTATAQVLSVISSSPGDLKPVFEAILSNAMRICEANFGHLLLYDGEAFTAAALHNSPPLYAEHWKRGPVRPGPKTGVGRMVATKQVVHIPDISAEAAYAERDPIRVITVELAGARTFLAVPMLKDQGLIGAIVIYRQEVRPFSDKQIELLSNFAAQAVIAIENARLLNELRQRTDNLTESLEQQTATSEILRVISNSRTDLEPVFDTIVANAVRLCGARMGAVFRFDGELLHLVAHHNYAPEVLEVLHRTHPRPPQPDQVSGRAILTRAVVQVGDTLADPNYLHEMAHAGNWRSILGVPMLHADVPIGVIVITRNETGPFSLSHINLLKSFADQAVIAIENVRLFEAEQQRSRELTESLQQQTATADVLKVISRSTFDLQAVLDTLVESAARLCEADTGIIRRREGDTYPVAATFGLSAEQRAHFERYSTKPDRGSVFGRAILEGGTVHVPDVGADPEYAAPRLQQFVGAGLGVPLVREGSIVGVFTLQRKEPRPFSPKQIELVTTFADQAVIAIENARLLNELRQRTDDLTESLEQQTATSEILSVISSSPGELASVFQAILEKATRICEANFALSHLYENGRFRRPSMYNLPPAFAQANAGREPSFQPHRLSPLAQAARTKQVVHISDMSEQAAYKERDPGAVRMVELGAVRTILTVPMLKDEELIGTISIYRQEVRPFTEKQIGLLQSFAAQAVIAIENARLLNELRESLQQQTATADVLKVISRSQTNVQPVFDAIVSSAVRLLRGYSGAMTRTVADHIELVAFTSIDNAGDASLRAVFPQSLKSEIPHARAIRDRAPINIADTQTDPRTPEAVRATAHTRGFRSWVRVPLLRYDEAIGTIAVTRREPGGFNEDEISLLRTFADQAVIAIENARLLDELQARNRDLTALGEVGRAVSSTLDLKVVLKTIVDRAVELSGTDGGSIFYYRQEAARFELGETSGLGDELVATIRKLDIAAGQTGLGEAITNRRPLQMPDVAQRPSNALRDAALEAGLRASLIVPLLGSEGALGALLLQRRHTGDFSPSVVSLMQSFADQSAIALENARLFEEIAQKSRELEIASQHKSQFVANMSHELRTPLAAMLGYAELMEEGIYEPLGEKSLAALTRIRSNGKHLLGLINTVLDIAKIESGQFTLNMQEYSIETVVETVRAATESLAQNKKLALTTAVAKPLPIGVGDEQRLTHVLLNLVGNAIKFTDKGEVRVTAEAVDGHFAVSVVDTGPGIPEQERSRIFEQFHQIDDSNTKAKGGTGLGLAIAKQIVEMHGGRIWVDSTVGKGSTFWMELPIRAEKMIA